MKENYCRELNLQNTGQRKYNHIHDVVLLKMKNLSNEKIGGIIGKSRTYVNNKFNFAIEMIKKNIA